MKKFVSILLSVLLILPVIASFGVGAAAEEDYSELYAQREAYMWEHFEDGIKSGWWGEYRTDAACLEVFIDHYLVVLLYTDAAEHLTLSKGPDAMWDGSDLFDGYSAELDDFFSVYYYDIFDEIDVKGSILRALVQHFGITKQELRDAYKEMKENPDAIRPVLSFLTDQEFESGRNSDGYFGGWDIPEFMFEALFIEDEVIAQNLLCLPFTVYVEDHGLDTRGDGVYGANYISDVHLFELSGQYWHCTPEEEFDNFLKCDLTSIGMGNFVEYLKGIDISRNDDVNYPRLQKLIAAREAQLQAKQTGDGTVTSVVVLALAVPTLAALVWVRKKRKI